MYDVITIGAASLDIFVKSEKFITHDDTNVSSGKVISLEFGSKIEVDPIQITSGGGATNTAVSFARKGLKAAVVAELGTELPATTVVKDLKRENVDASFLIQEQAEKTNISVVLVCPDGGRSILVYRGAGNMLEIRDIPWKMLDTNWLYITSLGGEFELLYRIIEYAVQNKINIAFNPGSKELAQPEKLKPLICKFKYFMVNREEAAKLLQIGSSEESTLDRQLPALGAEVTVITNGSKGAHIFSIDQQVHCSTLDSTSVESTGAGDAFGSGFVTGLIKGWSLHQCCQLAVANASSVIGQIGAKKGLISLDQINDWGQVQITPLNL